MDVDSSSDDDSSSGDDMETVIERLMEELEADDAHAQARARSEVRRVLRARAGCRLHAVLSRRVVPGLRPARGRVEVSDLPRAHRTEAPGLCILSPRPPPPNRRRAP